MSWKKGRNVRVINPHSAFLDQEGQIEQIRGGLILPLGVRLKPIGRRLGVLLWSQRERIGVATMTTSCAACSARGKTWIGDDPKCAFPNDQEFNPNNWNCATVNMVRDLMPRFGQRTNPRVSKPHYNDDQYWATIDLTNIDLPTGYAETLWSGWYKSRGRTEAMWLLSSDIGPRLPKETDLVAILETIANEQK